MFSVSVELLHGVFRGDADGMANTGHLAIGEWPPSPTRLFAAFVAADGTGAACRVTDGSELEWLEGLQPPTIYADPQPTHTQLLPRYIVEHRQSGNAKTQHQEYPARKGTRVWPGVRVCPRTPVIHYTWDTPLPSADTFAALQRRAARIGYLGTADSPVRVQVLLGDCLPTVESQEFVTHPDGQTLVNVPQAGDLAIWDRMHKQWIERGASLSRTQFHALKHKARYRNPATEKPLTDRGQVVAWLRVEPAVSGRRVSDMTELFKKALLAKYQLTFGEPPAVLHGHGVKGKGHDNLARYLALPDVGSKWSKGLIHGLALWMPPSSVSLDRRQARDAAFSIRKLTGRGIHVSVGCQDSEIHPWATHPGRWQRKSRVWATAVPAIHERWRSLSLANLAVWCAHAGLPKPVDFRSTRTPLVPGGIDLAPSEVHRPGRPVRPYSHIEIRFEEPIPGPVVIGAGRQRGFGLCIPMDDPTHSSTSTQ